MILIDTNVFIIDRFFPNDEHYDANKAFVGKLDSLDAFVSVYNLFELLGLASFNLNEEEFKRWFYEFDHVYAVRILYPPGLDNSLDNHFIWLWTRLFAVMSKRMTYVDALLLALAESLEAECIVTWNKRDFEGRTEEVSVLNPEDFIAKVGKEMEESDP